MVLSAPFASLHRPDSAVPSSRGAKTLFFPCLTPLPEVPTRAGLCFYRCLMALLFVLPGFTSLAVAEWKEKVVYSFQGHKDGQLPIGGIVFDSVGNPYGATTQGVRKIARRSPLVAPFLSWRCSAEAKERPATRSTRCCIRVPRHPVETTQLAPTTLRDGHPQENQPGKGSGVAEHDMTLCGGLAQPFPILN